MGAALNQPRASIHSFIDKIDAKAWLIQARMVVAALSASEVCNENRTKAARERRAILRQTVDAFQKSLAHALATTRHSIFKVGKVRTYYGCRVRVDNSECLSGRCNSLRLRARE